MIVTVTTTIDRPTDEVYNFLVDCSNDPRWRTNIRESTLVAGKVGQLGASYRVVASIMGQNLDMQARLVDSRPGESFNLAVSGPQGEMVSTTSFAGTANSTNVTISTDLSALGPMAAMAAGMVKAETAKDMERLVELFAQRSPAAVTSDLSETAKPKATVHTLHVAQPPERSEPKLRSDGRAESTSVPEVDRRSNHHSSPRYSLRPTDHGTRRKGDQTSLYDIAHALEGDIRQFEDQLEIDRRIPDELAAKLYEAGVFSAFTPGSLGGMKVDPVEWLEMVEELSRISGAVGWLAMVNSGGVIMPKKRYNELTDNGRIPWIAAFNAGRMSGKAKRVEGGYRVTGRWPFTSGSPHANFVGGLSVLHDEDDQVVIAADGLPWTITSIFRKEDVRLIDTWDGLGVRGSGSGDFEVVDAFIPAYAVDRSMRDAPFNEMLLRENMFVLAAHSAHSLGLAQAALDEFITLCNGKKADGSRRQGEMGRQQIHRINVAKADAIIRSSRLYAHDTVQRVWDEMHSSEEGIGSLEARALMMASFSFVTQQCREAVELIFKSAGVTGVFRGTRLERIFRDMMTVAQHIVVTEDRLEDIGHFLLTQHSPQPFTPIMLAFTVRTPKPQVAAS